MLSKIFNEKGIIDIIYEYNSGIGVQKLRKIINKNFYQFNPNILILEELTQYILKILSKGFSKNNRGNIYIKIYIKKISGIISGKTGLYRLLMYKHNHEHSLYLAIEKTINDIQNIFNNKYTLITYGS